MNFNYEDFVIKLNTKEWFDDHGMFERPEFFDRYIIVKSNEPNVYYYEHNNQTFRYFDYFGDSETKLTIPEAMKKLPQLFI
jgi:hypothetical protein